MKWPASSDSVWDGQLSGMAESLSVGTSPYWLVPFQNYKTFCPYLVGSYEEVSQELARYVRRGFQTFLLDVAAGPDEFSHISTAFQQVFVEAVAG